jgi:hypothetical protein
MMLNQNLFSVTRARLLNIIGQLSVVVLVASLLLVTACGGAKKWKPQDAVQVEWKGSWYQATILEAKDDGNYKIHYDGWSSSWDEVVPPNRIRERGAGAAVPPPQQNLDIPAVSAPASAAEVDQNVPAFDAALKYKKGDKVRIMWGSKWWAGEILEVQDGDKYKIHYDGWNASSDEVVGNDRLRPAAQ